jgi:hypothetical protein
MEHFLLVVRLFCASALALFKFTFAGSDGTIHFWDKDARTRLKSVLRINFLFCFDLNFAY